MRIVRIFRTGFIATLLCCFGAVRAQQLQAPALPPQESDGSSSQASSATASVEVPSAQSAPFRIVPAIAHAPILISHNSVSFGSLVVDDRLQRVIASQYQERGVTSVSLASHNVKHLAAMIPTGIALDEADNKLFVTDLNNRVLALDRKSLAKIDQFKIEGHAGTLAYDPSNHLLLLADSIRSYIWIVDARQHTQLGLVNLEGAPGGVACDAGRAYVTVPSAGLLEAIDLVNRKVLATWQTAPAANPRGVVVDPQQHLAYVAGSNGELSVIDLRSGAVIGSAPIAVGVEKAVYDPISLQLFCASGSAGVVSVVQMARGGRATMLGNILTHSGARALALTRSTGVLNLWIAYSMPDGSYLQCFSPAG